jgi:hypothetical protein
MLAYGCMLDGHSLSDSPAAKAVGDTALVNTKSWIRGQPLEPFVALGAWTDSEDEIATV